MGSIWASIRDTALGAGEAALEALHSVLQPLFGANAWGWAIIALTIVIRIFLLPLAIKQIRSMRAMQVLQPKIKAIQKKHKVDRELMKKDPDTYRAKKQKLNEEMMGLYKEEGVNPAASCLPLLAQAPVFVTLFWVLRESTDIREQPFYFFTSFIADDSAAQGLGALVSASGWPGLLLIAMMIVTMFVMQKQMMARQASSGADNPMAQQQKIMLYVLPPFLGIISWNLPLGVLLYWVTTNAWQGGQQAIMLREVRSEAEDGTLGDQPGGGPAEARDPKKGGTKGRGAAPGGAPAKGKKASGDTPSADSKASGTGPKGNRNGSTDVGAKGGAKGDGKGGGKDGAAKGGPRSGSNGGSPGPAKHGPNGSSGPNGATGSSSGASRRRDHLPRRPNR